MKTTVLENARQLGQAAARMGANGIREAISRKGEANIIVATGASQFEMLGELTSLAGIDWPRVTMFHLDEYIGMDETHPASFVGYLKKRFTSKLPGLKAAHFVNGAADDPQAECERLNRLIGRAEIDVCFAGIGENGHLAFNDPPADFATETPFLIVELDERCRAQQLGEGWFASLAEVPTRAVSMSIRQIVKSRTIILAVPDRRKAEAVRGAVAGQMTPDCPASIVQKHPNCHLFLDGESASLLDAGRNE